MIGSDSQHDGIEDKLSMEYDNWAKAFDWWNITW